MAAISRIVEVLEGYRGRDKIIRLASYCSLFVGGSLNNAKFQGLGESLVMLSNNLNDCRMILRLFDDLSMILHCNRYGLGSKESDKFLQFTSLLNNLLMQAYYPVEHIAWARDHNILSGKSDKLWTVGILLWLGSLLISVSQSLWLLRILRKTKEERSDRNKQWYYAKQRQLIISAIGSLADAGNAVHWLPKGILWSGKFSHTVVGFLGTIASVALLYNYLNPVPSKSNQVVSKNY